MLVSLRVMLLFSTLYIGCNTINPAINNENEYVFFPMAIGYKWHYVNYSGVSAPDSQFSEIVDTSYVDGKCWYGLHTYVYRNGNIDTNSFVEYFSKDNNGVYHRINNSEYLQVISYPIYDGKKWLLSKNANTDQSLENHAIAEFIDSITVANKVYKNCFKIKSNISTIWVARDIGVIKNEHIYTQELLRVNF